MKLINKKLDRISFRGPDASDFKIYENKLILGQNRLSIIDLNIRSNQPFQYEHINLTFNGEIYNFNEIKAILTSKGYTFRTSSDTEVVCAAYLEYGEKCLKEFNGMFAFVLYDKKNNLLFGARDRMGQKPFYYSLQNQNFEFASQPSQIAIGNNYSFDEVALSQFFRWKYIPEPNSIYKEIKKLKAGHQFVFNLSSKKFETKAYWEIDQETNYKGTFEDAKLELKDLLNSAVSNRMISDVPLGIFLSGGIDSSLICAIAQNQSKEKLKTFSIGFQESSFDESKYAELVSSKLKTDHTKITCTYNEVFDLIDSFSYYYDEPFSDASAIPSMLLAKHTRKIVTVALTGDGGDENFIGYGKYTRLQKFNSLFKIPLFIRKGLSKGLKLSPKERHNKVLAKGIAMPSINELYYEKMMVLNNQWLNDAELGANPEYKKYLNSNKHLYERISDYDLKTYLVDDINTKVDRASMAFSLEARAPLLDYRIVNFARKLPTSYKVRGNNKKYILKEVLYEYLPKPYFDRPKSGFKMPFEIWFRTNLKEMVLDTLTKKNIQSLPNVNVNEVLKMIDAHMDGKENNYILIWTLLVFFNWQKHNTLSNFTLRN